MHGDQLRLEWGPPRLEWGPIKAGVGPIIIKAGVGAN